PMIEASKQLGATKGELLGYSTSGSVTGDMAQVVGYGAAAILRE
ncbi:AmmeMemoRadiSam system protein B, partial [Candidatus Fervidibacteria bacterium JGI MDM2 JNZ-1-D12]